MFVIVFGQLTLVLFFPQANTYGSICSFLVALVLRLLCGDKAMGIPPVITFGTIYGEPGSCPIEADPAHDPPIEADPEHACEGPVPFRIIVTVIGIVSPSSPLSALNTFLPAGPPDRQLPHPLPLHAGGRPS